MNDYNQSYEDENTQDFYQYNLWQNSHFNNGFHFSQGWYGSSLCSSDDEEDSAPHQVEVKTEGRDIKSRRVIMKIELYGRPDLSDDDDDPYYDAPGTSRGYDWTKLNWKKAGQGPAPDSGPKASTKMNPIQKELSVAVAKPVETSKATLMMQKMGWHGGPLGRNGEGILEPIAPNAAYATTNFGLGHDEPTTRRQQKRQNKLTTRKEKKSKQFLKTNLLREIQSFVKDDKEMEILFDKRLHNKERKIVHDIVNFIEEEYEKVPKLNLDSAQMKLVENIRQFNNYVLGTQSEGEHPNRQLCLFKEAPRHVYLVSPYDIRDTDNVNSDDNPDRDKIQMDHENETASQETEKIDEEESNPFLESITRNLKNETLNDTTENSRKTLVEKLTGFFTEFVKDDVYTEFRFLGPFTTVEIDKLLYFVNVVSMYIDRGTCINGQFKDLCAAMDSEVLCFEVKYDCNESLVIYKTKKGVQMS